MEQIKKVKAEKKIILHSDLEILKTSKLIYKSQFLGDDLTTSVVDDKVNEMCDNGWDLFQVVTQGKNFIGFFRREEEKSI